MMTEPIYTIDFETLPIRNRPDYPPQPVSAAIGYPDGDEEFFAWGHPTGNNCSRVEAGAELRRVWDLANAGKAGLLFHHAKFDLAVAAEKLGLRVPGWRNIHDTMFLAFLTDPHSRSLDLKTLAWSLLDMPPDEQRDIYDYVLSHKKELVAQFGGKITTAKSGANSPYAYIGCCPGDIVEPYALGDIRRTRRLFDKLAPFIRDEGMWGAYVRERRILPIFLENESIGLRIDMEALDHDVNMYSECMDITENWLRRRLRWDGLNFNSDRDVAEALSENGIVDDKHWTLTKTGQRSVAKDNLTPDMFNDQQVAQALGYRNRLQTCLKMFMIPWLEQGSKRNGYISCNWNQVRGTGGGARTGRPSTSNPNFLNISKDFEGRFDGYKHPEHIEEIEHLPLVREYILPDEGEVFLHRDFDGQELRIFAHYEHGPLQKAYLENPNLDPHGWVAENLKQIVTTDLERTKVKILNFQAIYGGGAPAAAKELRVSLNEARQYKSFHDKALPGRKVLAAAIEEIVRQGEPIITWGGRVYYVERPKVIKGRWRRFEYKLINYLCQGGAADVTKEVLANWYECPLRSARFLVTVYDEINASCPEEIAGEQMLLLKEFMEDVNLNVPMRSSGKKGPNWGELEAWC